MLGVPIGELDWIESSNQKDAINLSKTLNIWLGRGENTTWKALATAVGSSPVGREDLKKRILENHP